MLGELTQLSPKGADPYPLKLMGELTQLSPKGANQHL